MKSTHKTIPTLSYSDLERFWSKVIWRGKFPCWEWVGHKLPNGYGVFTIHRQFFYAHRISAHIVDILIPNLHICHSCDNPGCVNYHHLFPGDDRINMLDAANKRRVGVFTHPEKYAHIKGSFELADEIRNAVGTQRSIAKRFEISQSTVSRIKSGEIW